MLINAYLLIIQDGNKAKQQNGENEMRAPVMTPERAEREKHYAAVKEIVGNLNLFGGLETEDLKVYNHFTGTPEAVAARILTAREGRVTK